MLLQVVVLRKVQFFADDLAAFRRIADIPEHSAMFAAPSLPDRPIQFTHGLVADRQRFRQHRAAVPVINIAVQNRFRQKFVMHERPF